MHPENRCIMTAFAAVNRTRTGTYAGGRVAKADASTVRLSLELLLCSTDELSSPANSEVGVGVSDESRPVVGSVL